MKKNVLSIILSAMVLLGTVAFSACGNGDKLAELEAKLAQFETLTVEQQEQIKTQQEKIVELEETIDQREATIKNLAKGRIFELATAYDLGFISKDDLLSIAYYCNRGNNGNEEVMGENFVPQPKSPEYISQDIEQEIKEVIKKKWIEDYGYTEINYGGVTLSYYVTITGYYGAYGNCVALAYTESLLGYTGVEMQEKIAGINFTYASSGHRIFVWVKSN